MNPRLVRYLATVKDLPTMPRVAHAVLKAVEDPKCSVGDLREIIEQDPPIVARILKVANSSLYGFPRQIDTLNHAIALLGMRTVKNLVLAVSLREAFTKLGLMSKLLWEHSSMAGPTASRLARELCTDVNPEEAFTAGLLHDLGKIALANSHADEYEKVVARTYNEGIGFVEAERFAFGFDHAELGAEVATKWKLPASLETAIRYHHDPQSMAGLPDADWQLAALVAVTTACLSRLGIGRKAPVEALDLAALEVWRRIELDENQVEPVLDMVSEEVKKAEAIMVA